MGDSAETSVDVLLIEDNPGDVRLVEEALHETPGTLHIVNNGREALDFLHQREGFTDAPRPNTVLLDLNLPKVDGTEVLREIREKSELEQIRVVVITTAEVEYTELESDVVDEVNFLTKPADPDEFMSRIRSSVIN